MCEASCLHCLPSPPLSSLSHRREHTPLHLALPLALSALLAGPLCAAEGVLLARRNLAFLAGAYGATVALLTPALLAVKARGGPVELTWACFAVFQGVRACLFAGRVLWARLAKGNR